MDEDTARQREDLSLVLQPTEWGRKDKTVVVAFELCTIIMTLWVTVLLPQSFIGYQLLPIHHMLLPQSFIGYQLLPIHHISGAKLYKISEIMSQLR